MGSIERQEQIGVNADAETLVISILVIDQGVRIKHVDEGNIPPPDQIFFAVDFETEIRKE